MANTETQSAIGAYICHLREGEEDRIIREPECERITGESRTTRWRKEKNGLFPKRVKLSDNAVGWRLSEIRAYIFSLPRAA